ncbi:hypothetical protein V6U90_23780 [Micromonospora sp. CPCC 206060]
MACLPIVVAMVLCADELIDRVVCGFADWREARRERRTISHLDRAVEADLLTRDYDLTEFDRADRLSIEQIAADLRNLGGHRVGLRSRAVLWDPAVLQAYDERLRQASRCLGITEHLADLEGVDREIERIRVEGELHAAGLALPAARGVRGQRQR